MSQVTTLNRRNFLKITSGLTFGFMMPSVTLGAGGKKDQGLKGDATAWVHIAEDGEITIRTPASEMGQGSMTSLPLIFAEELDADWGKVKIEFAPADDTKYGNPISWGFGLMLTVGSTAVHAYFQNLRLYGAQARKVLLMSAAEKWGVPVSELTTEPSVVVHAKSGRKLNYGDIAAFRDKPVKMPEVSESDLKDPSEFRLIGKQIPRYEIPAKTDGSAKYSIDINLPDMLYATVAHSPVRGATPIKINDGRARQVPGVVDVIKMPTGVAVVAKNYHAAWKAERELDIAWSEVAEINDFNDGSALVAHVRTARDLTKHAPMPVKKEGDMAGALEEANKTLEYEFQSDFVYHAHLEPLNAVANVKGDQAEIWAGTQSPTHLLRAIAQALSIPDSNITVNRTLLGGGFGRRAAMDHDWALDAVMLSQQLKRPVKVIWSRETDLRNGRFKPITAHYLRAALDKENRLTAWSHRIASDEALSQSDPFRFAKVRGWPVISSPGAMTPYDVAVTDVEVIREDMGVRISPVRGVGATPNKFASESFMDEIAVSVGEDPLEFRLRHLQKHPEGQRVLRTVADMSGWNAQKGFGVSYVEINGEHLATVAEVNLDRKSGLIRVRNVWLCADIGIAVQPDNVISQLEGAALFGLSNALKERVTFSNGAVEQSNFHDYKLLRMDETPLFHTRIIDSARPPVGVGELTTVGVPAAVANAFKSLTGKRLQHLPMTPDRVLNLLKA